jgi:hypothetical protein
MLLPAIAAAREKARRTACMSNLSQFGKGLALYASDHDEAYPSLMTNLGVYIDNPKLWKCKSDGTVVVAPSVGAIATTAESSYNMTTNGRNAACPSVWWVICDANGGGEVTDTGFGGNHQGAGGNLLFVDASVQWYNADMWTNPVIRNTNGADFTSGITFN